MSTAVEPQTTWTAHDVPGAALESELERLWQQAHAALAPDGEARDTDDPPAVARARVLNFVAYASNPLLARRVMEQVTNLAARHPSRIIIITAQEDGTDPALCATASAHAQSTGDGRRILHEQVEIDARGPVAESLPSIVVPLLIPDLPTYLWWPGDLPVGHAFWRRMVDACNRLIVDSADFSRPLDAMAGLAEFYRSARRFHTFGDLNWHRLTQWRELIAQFFDNQAYRPYLDHVDTLEIEYSAAAGGASAPEAKPACALLLAGWLSARLGWECVGCQVDGDALRYQLVGWPSGRSLSLVLRQGKAAESGGRIDSVHVTAAADGRQADFQVIRDDGGLVAHAVASIGRAAGAPRTVSMADGGLAPLLATALQDSGHDENYEATLAVAGAMARHARNLSRG